MSPTRPRLLAATALLGFACSSAPTPAVAPVPPPPPPGPVVAPAGAILPEVAVTQFGLDAYAHLRSEPGNLAFSPASIFMALSLLHAGSGGDTLDDLTRAMHLQQWDSDGLDAAFASWMNALQPAGRATTGPRLDLANGIWTRQGGNLAAAYRERIERAFRTEVSAVDFIGAPEPQRKLINGWIADHTGDMIEDLLPPGSIDSSTVVVLANAVYFLGDWVQAFDPDETRDGTFHLGDGTTATAELMHRAGPARFANTGDALVLELPYQDSTLAMTAVLPGAGKRLADVEASLSPATVQGWVDALHLYDDGVDITLPRFKIDQRTDLNKLLVDLGLGSLFSHVDLTRMFGAPGGLELSGAFHQTVVDVTEKGTEAAAATALVIRESRASRLPPTFHADQPFLWMIRDTKTGAILFMGRVSDPR